ncbi:MAG: metal-sulfur cluster assembly factor [Rhodocyclaceae bacterium]|nr:metal-sulfur cluster assembly factor [Rhodocyclaceae bacterium]
MSAGLPDEQQVLDALRTIADPEAGIDIVELGLIYGVAIGDRSIRIDMTTTSPACPTGSMMREDARAAVAAIVADDVAVEVVHVWEPPWEPDRMSEAAKKKLGW